jgi:D-glycero-alpha-D-manno-heptose-7-phosphate kinase
LIITRTPLRITLGGGGTDLPSYYERFGGSLIAAAINKYIFVSLNRTFTPGYLLKYSEMELVDKIDQIEHAIIRKVLQAHELEPALELVSVADIPTGTGLGSSGTFTVGLLRAVYAQRREHVASADLAEEACSIEIDVLGRAVGKQDQYIAAFGGLTCFDFEKDGSVQVSPLRLSSETMHDLEEHLLMFFTRFSRNAEGVLHDQKTRSESDDSAKLENLHVVKRLGIESRPALERGDTGGFAELMLEHWEYKKSRSDGMSNGDIDRWYQAAMDSGAIGGKLVGAGGGGFLLFYTRNPSDLRRAMTEEGLEELRFAFDHDGSTVLART